MKRLRNSGRNSGSNFIVKRLRNVDMHHKHNRKSLNQPVLTFQMVRCAVVWLLSFKLWHSVTVRQLRIRYMHLTLVNYGISYLEILEKACGWGSFRFVCSRDLGRKQFSSTFRIRLRLFPRAFMALPEVSFFLFFKYKKSVKWCFLNLK